MEEYNKLAKNYREHRWEPAELSGGKLCEIVYTILEGYIAGVFAAAPSKPRNMVDACKKLEQTAASFPRSIQIQIPRMLVALYEIRNNRNVGHVGGDVDPNHMDATVVFSMCQWIMAELVRVFHRISLDDATKVVDNIVERPIPIVWKVGDRTRVLSSTLSAKEKMLVVTYASSVPMTLKEVVASIEYSSASVFRSKVAKPAHKAHLIDLDPKTEVITLTPVGVKYVEEKISLTFA